jgi:hypothetical protein
MPIVPSSIWFLRKHDNGEIFGPISFEHIREWASNAYVNPQDSVSYDGVNWTKAPMITELQMDWLIETPDYPLYGPTTSGAILEFLRIGEITSRAQLINCCTAERMILSDAPFFDAGVPSFLNDALPVPAKSGIKLSLQQRIRDLEIELLEKRVQINTANQKIVRLEVRLHDLDAQLKEAS